MAKEIVEKDTEIPETPAQRKKRRRLSEEKTELARAFLDRRSADLAPYLQKILKEKDEK